ncbi:MAG TPA: hypothetical protein VM468_06320 [Mycoplana sp.]|nr:hypothetical protein [Mycoplana sp.]
MGKHTDRKETRHRDLKDNLGIGQSRGIRNPEDEEDIERARTVEGDVAKDTTPRGGVDPNRTNK